MPCGQPVQGTSSPPVMPGVEGYEDFHVGTAADRISKQRQTTDLDLSELLAGHSCPAANPFKAGRANRLFLASRDMKIFTSAPSQTASASSDSHQRQRFAAANWGSHLRQRPAWDPRHDHLRVVLGGRVAAGESDVKGKASRLEGDP